tara:strand:- start:160 stop:306 length:147 start_codon:yes stop_codon:yes gene_type:complete
MSQQSSQAPAFVHPYGPEAEQLPVVITEDEKKEEEWEPQSLEEALLGE